MTQLKEIKARIQSVKSTQKITSAMKMVSSVKLQKAEKKALNTVPYKNLLSEILTNFISSEVADKSIFAHIRDVRKVAIVAFASNTSLCGSYNASIIKRLHQSVKTHRDVRKENVYVFPIGKKVAHACNTAELNIYEENEELASNPSYELAAKLADLLMELYLAGEIDRVKIIYFHYESRGKQVVTADTFLPLEISGNTNVKKSFYIFEPNEQIVTNKLIPLVLRLKIYATALEALASEHAARTIAMQKATENANDMLHELSVQYNKLRQQAITNELLDIMGGSFK